ncbi:MAG: YitT family protein [Clostridia bacterium]|nr:YitT family protein [Clostridia bacterium]
MNSPSFNLKTALTDLIFALAGSFLYAAAVHMFIDPNKISVGGFTGIGSLLHYLWAFVPIGTVVFVMNLPLFLLSWKKLGKKFFFKTLFATFTVSVALDLTGFLPTFTENKLLAAIAGGVCVGAGLGLIFSRGMATGGTDLLAKLIKGKFRGLSYGKIILVFDAVILTVAAIVYKDMWSILYSAITVWLSSTVIDNILSGMDKAKSVSVITKHKQEVLDSIFRNFYRGATVWTAEGGYTKEEKDIILIVVRNYELFQLKRTVKEADPNAFMIISDATEVMGLGFREGPPEE